MARKAGRLKKILDLEVIATSGDHERRAWVASVDTFQIEDYAKVRGREGSNLNI
jgi:hypothetical protein